MSYSGIVEEMRTRTANDTFLKTSNDTSKSPRDVHSEINLSTSAMIHCHIHDSCRYTVLGVLDCPLQPEVFGNEDIPFIDE